jgi:hypothetical protein
MGEENEWKKHDRKVPCVIINCGDDHDGGKDKGGCCDVCDTVHEGHRFVAGADIGYISPVATELAAALLVNPAGSGKNIVVTKRQMTVTGSSDENVLFKFCFDPVVIANGIPVPPVCLNQTPAMGVTIAQFYSSPTVGATGTLIDAFNVDSAPAASDEVIVLGEGHSLLVTERANAENTRAAAYIYWQECKIRHHHDEQPGSAAP